MGLVLLIRHAVTAETGALLSGRKPGIPLSDAGREQAARLGERLRDVPLTAVYASPIQRTKETAAAIAAGRGLRVRIVKGLLEVDYGDWTGGTLKELAKTDLWRVVQARPSAAVFPNGEGMAAMQARVVAAIAHLATQHRGEAIAVVGHADPIKAAVAHFTGAHLDAFQRYVISPASVTALLFGPHGAALLRLNDVGDYSDLRVPSPNGGRRTKRGR